MMLTIPHLVRACNFPFAERMLTVDVSPLLKSFASRPGVGTLDELRACCSELVKDNVIDTVVEIDNSEQCRRSIFKKHIRGYTRQAKDSRGSAVLGYLFGIEQAKTRYLLHFDSDMLLFQRPGSSWVARGIRLLDQNPDVMCVLPLAGPPTADGTLEQSEPYQHDPRGIFTFKSFTSRKYLIDVERFCKLLPVDALWRSVTKRVREYLTNRSGLTTWERMVSGKLRKSSYIRADIDSPDAWTLHSRDRGELYCRYLPDIIAAVERGEYPAENAGKYDLNLKAYIQLVESKRRG